MTDVPIIRYRPHHFLCSLGFQGKGYSDGFTANMSQIVDGQLRAPDGADQIIEVTFSTDDICGPCPRRIGTLCTSQWKISGLDKRHAAALDLKEGARLTWGEAKRRMRANITPEDLVTLCKGCSWLDHGMCSAALRRLHATNAQ